VSLPHFYFCEPNAVRPAQASSLQTRHLRPL
jgi:hypothetical protein